MEFLNSNDNDDYIYDMFDTFKRRLISSDDNDDDNGDSNSRDESKIGDGSDSGDVQLMLVDALRRNNKDDSNNYKLPKSVFSNGNNKIGEVEFNQLSGIPPQYKSILVCPKDLILLTNCHINDRYNYPPSFIDFGNDEFFNYTLPITWIPLIPNRYLSHLEKHYNLVIQDDQGFSNIKMSIDTSPNSASSSGAKMVMVPICINMMKAMTTLLLILMMKFRGNNDNPDIII